MTETKPKPTEKQSRYKANREKIKALSKGLQQLVKNGALDTVNDGLKAIYAEQGHTELKTFWEWKEEGKSVKKGEKALLLWGRPRQSQQDDDEDDEFKFYPLCYVFSNLQVK